MSDEFDPLTLHLRGETACQTQMWIRSQLEIFWAQLFPNFPEMTRSKIVCEIGTCNSKCETVEQISKRGYGNNFVFAEETDFILEKRTTKHPDKKTG